MNRVKEMVIQKLFKVIDSMDKVEHIYGVRNYIDSYYNLYGLQNKGIIEIYFRTRKQKFI
jgi:hypothetical protein|tara:strand:+ start:138 stop:317 length:180 start_codon:yes stop_codon:yes gene_type:complete